MITNRQKLKLKAIFGYRYAPIIQLYLKEYNIKNADGSEVSQSMIRQVFNNYREHEAIEEGIFKAAADHDVAQKLAFKKKKEERNKLLENIKAVAGTTA